jgi:hypothetical protein
MTRVIKDRRPISKRLEPTSAFYFLGKHIGNEPLPDDGFIQSLLHLPTVFTNKGWNQMACGWR